MKTISIVVPCYNEEENVGPLADALREMFRKDLPDYRYEILFIDNDSRDKTRDLNKMISTAKCSKGSFQSFCIV